MPAFFLGEIYRSDLIFALVRIDAGVISESIEDALGFQRIEATFSPRESVPVTPLAMVTSADGFKSSIQVKRKYRSQTFFIATEFDEVNLDKEEDAPTDQQIIGAIPLEIEDCTPRDRTQINRMTLLSQHQFRPLLKSSLNRLVPGKIDINRLVDRISFGHLPDKLPRLSVSTIVDRVDIIFDQSDRLSVYRGDYADLVGSIISIHGRNLINMWFICDSPSNLLRCIRLHGLSPDENSRFGDASDFKMNTIELAKGGNSVVYIMSDLGMLSRTDESYISWGRFLSNIHADRRICAWVPHSERFVSSKNANLAEIYCMTNAVAGRLKRSRGFVQSIGQRHSLLRENQKNVELLLTFISFCIRVEPELLRRVRRISPALSTEPGLEALVWGSQFVESGRVSRAVRQSFLPDFLNRLNELSPSLLKSLLLEVLEVHKHVGRSTESIEALIWETYAKDDAKDQQSAKIASDARDWFNRLVSRIIYDEKAGGIRSESSSFSSDLLDRFHVNEKFSSLNRSWLSHIFVRSGNRVAPEGLSHQDILFANGVLHASEKKQSIPYSVVFDGDQLSVSVDGTDTVGWRSRVGPILRADRLMATQDDRTFLWIDSKASTVQLAALDGSSKSILVSGGGYRIKVEECFRPKWSCSWGRDAYGIFADLQLREQRCRFRYIEPGYFKMGGTDEDRQLDADSDEFPRHTVIVSRGFWLAESPLSVDFWSVLSDLMVDNEFGYASGLSWNSAVGFCSQLQKFVGDGWRVSLPTEAQWEYACRAESESPYSVSLELILNDSRGANPWGLIDMHGKIWEWCRDSGRCYASWREIDPVGSLDSEFRVVRGGAANWGYKSWRASKRLSVMRSKANSYIGLRLAIYRMG